MRMIQGVTTVIVSCVLMAGSFQAHAAVPVDTITTDLETLIRGAVSSPVQFAVHIPHVASPSIQGQWTVKGAESTWRYAVRVPTAVSMSFHATPAALPAGAVLVVRSAKTTIAYRARDIRSGELWSRVQPGDTLEFQLSVPTAQRTKVVLNVRSVQAGYRSIGPGVKDHPYYAQLAALQAGATNAACAQNYECHVSPSNTPPAQATVGITVQNLYQCTATLINDIPGDSTPYLLTARHCETGRLGGGNPGAAAAVTVYWDAVSSCGSTLGSLYDPGITSQTGATTVVEQQDAWLLELNESPVVTDAQYAGFDASGGAIQGGYSVHHALGYDKQYTAWFGQPASVQQANVLGTAYLSNFWETVNQTGNVGPGASGGGLFDQNNRLVGSLSLGRTSGDSSGYGSCPASSPPVPDGTNGVADFTSLAAIWNSTADSTSSTPTSTLKSILDPGNTGTLIVSSVTGIAMTFTAAYAGQTINSGVPLNWSANGATACTASGGVGGDGWAGSVAANGTQTITESTTGNVSYTLSCLFSGGRTASRTVTVNWVGPTPQLTLWSERDLLWTTRPANLIWTSNVSPCSIKGGSTSSTNLASSGSLAVTEANPGDVTYTLTCGANPPSSVSWVVSYSTPTLAFGANGDDRLVGEPLTLGWVSYADSCIPSGGAPGDGWSTAAFDGGMSQPYFASPTTTPGTYSYSLRCVAGPLSVTGNATATVENNAPTVSTSVDKMTTTYTASPADYIALSWDSNLTTCTPSSTPPMGPGAIIPNPPYNTVGNPKGTVSLGPTGPGTYVLSVKCTALLTGAAPATSIPITVTVKPPPPPTASLTVTPSTVNRNQLFSITWSSTNASSCTAAGGNALSSPFVGALPSPNGTQQNSTQNNGTYSLSVTCQSVDSSQGTALGRATLTVVDPTPTVVLTASGSSFMTGQSIGLTWSSTNATSCVAAGGGANGSAWSGTLTTSGSTSQGATTVGTFTYTVTCSAGGKSAQASATITVSASSSGGGGGGGGSIDLVTLAMLAALAARRRHRAPAG